MLLCLPFCAKDKALAVRLAGWLEELGGCKEHDSLLVVHKDTDSSGVMEPLTRAFGRCAELIIRDEMVSDRAMYQYCANVTWKRCAQWIADMKESGPWVWLEPDAVPLVPDWLDALDVGYRACGKPFMLDLVITPTSRHNSGIGVYPARVRDYTQRLWELANDPWDVFFARDFMPHTHHGPLIQDNAANPDPSFLDANSLSIIKPAAVLFHRDKSADGLINRLRESRGGEVVTQRSHKPQSAGSIPAPETLRTIYTYLEPLGERWDDPELTELCAESWKRQGWKLVILTDADARKHPLHDALMGRKELHSPNDLHDYINACYRRWCAYSLAAKDGAWFCDLDVIAYEFPTEIAAKIKHGRLVEFYNDRATPCMLYGTTPQFEGIIGLFLEYAAAPHLDSKHLQQSVSDQTILDYYPERWERRMLVAEYLEPDWDKAPIVHFPFAKMYLPGGRGSEIKRVRALPSQEVALEHAGSDRKVDPKIFTQNLLPKDHIAALVVLAGKDTFAKGRIVKQLKAAGFELAKARTGRKSKSMATS